MNIPDSPQELLHKASINNKLAKWMPRLCDQSVDVREKAAETLSELALGEPELRNSLLPVLLKHCITEKSWTVTCNSILFNISPIPEKSPEWVDDFLSVYLLLSVIHDREVTVFSGPVIRGHALAYIYDLIKAGRVTKEHPKMKKIMEIVTDGLSRNGGSASGEERLSMMHIFDWFEDS